MEISIYQAENGISLDELVKKFADVFENKAFADILKMNLQLTQEVLMYRIFNNSNNLSCCPDGYLTLNSSFERRGKHTGSAKDGVQPERSLPGFCRGGGIAPFPAKSP
jgi:hypothetical protein